MTKKRKEIGNRKLWKTTKQIWERITTSINKEDLKFNT